MTTTKLKSFLKKEIDKVDSKETLEILQIVLETRNNQDPELTEWQLKRIEESEKQFEKGQVISKEKADKKIEEWLKL